MSIENFLSAVNLKNRMFSFLDLVFPLEGAANGIQELVDDPQNLTNGKAFFICCTFLLTGIYLALSGFLLPIFSTTICLMYFFSFNPNHFASQKVEICTQMISNYFQNLQIIKFFIKLFLCFIIAFVFNAGLAKTMIILILIGCSFLLTQMQAICNYLKIDFNSLSPFKTFCFYFLGCLIIICASYFIHYFMLRVFLILNYAIYGTLYAYLGLNGLFYINSGKQSEPAPEDIWTKMTADTFIHLLFTMGIFAIIQFTFKLMKLRKKRR